MLIIIEDTARLTREAAFIQTIDHYALYFICQLFLTAMKGRVGFTRETLPFQLKMLQKTQSLLPPCVGGGRCRLHRRILRIVCP